MAGGFTTEEHWRFFAEFCAWEMASGGPDPQISLVRSMSREVSWEERVWRAGCYIAVYNVPYGELLWRHWPWERVQTEERDLLSWLRANWAGITTRVERRSVRRPEWLAEFLVGYARYAESLPALLGCCDELSPEGGYEKLWEESLRVPRLGRYVALKLLEFYRQEGFRIAAPDIRPRGGWSPRRMLSILWEDPEVSRKSDQPRVLERINQRCTETQARLRSDWGLDLDLFKLQVALCEYRESWEGRRQYPGRSLDSELRYALRAEAEWGHRSSIWDARAQDHPPEHLGELHGWDGPRLGPASVLADWGYTWTDLRYDYGGTSDWAAPACRSGVSPPTVTPQPPAPEDVPSPRREPRQQPRIYEVLPGQLYQSARWTLLSPDAGRALAAAHGITGLVNFWKDEPQLSEMVEWYRWWPLSDGRRVPAAVLHQIVSVVAAYIAGGGVVLSMCYGGRNRSGLVSALVVQRLRGCSGTEAAGVVKRARRGALVNQHFLEYVHSLEHPDDLRPSTLF